MRLARQDGRFDDAVFLNGASETFFRNSHIIGKSGP
jgi:hypothetical protein